MGGLGTAVEVCHRICRWTGGWVGRLASHTLLQSDDMGFDNVFIVDGR